MTPESTTAPRLAECAWTGVGGDGEHVVRCGRAAYANFEDKSGQIIYACDEHLSQIKARLETGHYVQHHEPGGTGEDLSRRAVSV